MSVHCPSSEHLQQYLIGDLPDPLLEAISLHVDQCHTCQQLVGQLDDPDDLLTQNLRRTSASDPYEAEPECLQLLTKLKDLVDSLSPTNAALDEDTDPVIGTADLNQIGPYRILEQLGSGGMGTVYKAVHPRLQKTVAVKVMAHWHMSDPTASERFQREMVALGQLDHPNIVRAVDAGSEGGVHYLVMDYVDGIDLSRLVRRLGPLPVAEACELIRHVAIGLHYAHYRGYVHRDLKPSNLMLCRSETPAAQLAVGGDDARHFDPAVKILDLGLARLDSDAAETRELTYSLQLLGTVDYMSPEQIEDPRHVDCRADIYSLGATLYKLLCGSAPFAGTKYKSDVRKVAATIYEPVPSIRSRRPEVPAELAAVMDQMLAKDLDHRFSSVCEVCTALHKFARGANLPALFEQAEQAADDAWRPEDRPLPRPISTRPAKDAPDRSRKRRLAALGLVAALPLALLVWAAINTPWRTPNVPKDDASLTTSGSTALESDRTVRSLPPPAELVFQEKLLAHGPQSYMAVVGHGVAMDGELAVIGVPGAMVGNIRCGAAYVLKYSDGGTPDDPSDDGWQQQAELTALDRSWEAGFGVSVAMRGDTVVVGAKFDDDNDQAPHWRGAAYVFSRQGQQWVQQQKLVPTHPYSQGFFGDSVAIGDGTLAVGAAQDGQSTEQAGAVYLYNQHQQQWSLREKLTSPSPSPQEAFAICMDLDDQTLIVSAYGKTQSTPGSAYIFQHGDDGWQLRQELQLGVDQRRWALGVAGVALHGDTLVVGSPDNNLAYVYNRQGGEWTKQQTLKPMNTSVQKFFGKAVAVGRDHIVIGSLLKEKDDLVGQASVFVRSQGNWRHLQTLTGPQPQHLDEFGQSMALADGRMLISACKEDTASLDAGAVYTYRLLDSPSLQQKRSDDRMGRRWLALPEKWHPPSQPGPNPKAKELAGSSVAVEANYLAMGIPSRSLPEAPLCGVVNVFVPAKPAEHGERLGSDTWRYQTTLAAPTPVPNAAFGRVVAASGDVIAVSTWHWEGGVSGNVYLFQREGDRWDFVQKLTPPDATVQTGFGRSLALDGDTLAVGAVYDETGPGSPGSVYMFGRQDRIWRPEQKLMVPGENQGYGFGWSVSVCGDQLAVGRPYEDALGISSGALYVFGRNRGGWQQQARIVPDDLKEIDHFGHSVAIGPDWLLVGAPDADDLGADSGAVYAFRRDGDTWVRHQKIYAFDAARDTRFGYCVTSDQSRLLVGAPKDSRSQQASRSGAVYVFWSDGSLWTQHQKLTTPDPSYKQYLGSSISIHGETVIAGAPQDRRNTGATYVFGPATPRP